MLQRRLYIAHVLQERCDQAKEHAIRQIAGCLLPLAKHSSGAAAAACGGRATLLLLLLLLALRRGGQDEASEQVAQHGFDQWPDRHFIRVIGFISVREEVRRAVCFNQPGSFVLVGKDVNTHVTEVSCAVLLRHERGRGLCHIGHQRLE